MSLGDGLPVGKRAMRYIRLERGCCGNTSCNATFYEIRLAPHPFLAWEQLAIGALEEHQEEKPGTAGVVAVAGWELAKKQISRRTIGALVALLTLWLFHQWYHGGSIPLIRGERTFSAEAGPAEGDDAP